MALSGAHALGRCHPDRSGYLGPWTASPITFSNQYYVLLMDEKWCVPHLSLCMLPSQRVNFAVPESLGSTCCSARTKTNRMLRIIP